MQVCRYVGMLPSLPLPLPRGGAQGDGGGGAGEERTRGLESGGVGVVWCAERGGRGM